MFPYVPGGLDDFVNLVVPELQRRSLFRTEYEGRTLRENLGLPRPANRFFPENQPNVSGSLMNDEQAPIDLGANGEAA
jgi:hypothetical protein